MKKGTKRVTTALIGTSRYLANKHITKYWNAFYECKNCKNIYSLTMKKLCNLEEIEKETAT
jgi:hypothetical protein